MDKVVDFVGNSKQLNGVYYIEFKEGKSTGLKAYNVFTESGLSMNILIDRGMDISDLKVDGKNVSFLSHTGLVNSNYFVEEDNRGFMRNFNVGFLTTGGLSYMGTPSKSKNFGLHGVISNTPADNYYYKLKENCIEIVGKVREAEMLGVNLVLERRIKVYTKEKKILVSDVVKNKSYTRTPLMLLYHVNFGYPFFNPNIRLIIDPEKTVNRDDNEIRNWHTFSYPEKVKNEEVYIHKMKKTEAIVESPDTSMRMKMMYSENLPILNEWKLESKGSYVLGLEPATNSVTGYDEQKLENKIQYLDAREERKFNLDFSFERI